MGDHEIAVDAVRRLQERLGAGDVEGAVACFVEDGATFGAELGERAHGHDELRDFLGQLVARPVTVGWELAAVCASRSDDALSFVSDAQVLLVTEDGATDRVPFRVAGVLREAEGEWRFELFNGTEPALEETG